MSIINEATIKHRRDTAGNWTSNNPTLNQGEWAYEIDTGRVKIGDGSTAWTSLSYIGEITVGSIMEWGGNPDLSDIPTGWLACDGSAISRATYANFNSLMSDASYPWGNGDGSTTFNLPKGAYNTGWVENLINSGTTPDWTAVHLGSDGTQNSNVIHELKAALPSLSIRFLVSPTGSDDDSFEPTVGSNEGSTTEVGYSLYNVDNDSFKLQTADDGVRFIDDSGGAGRLDNEAWYYKIVVTNKAMSARSIIKVS